MKVTVLGCGRWGTFLAWYAHLRGCKTTLWGREGSPRLARLKQTRQNDYVTLDSRIILTNDLRNALDGAQYVIISISAQNFEALLEQIKNIGIADPDRQVFVLNMKGIIAETGERLSQVFEKKMGSERVAVWVGPGHVQSFVMGIPNCMVIDSKVPELVDSVIDTFGSSLIRFYYGTDLIGNEIGAAAKNAVGIAAGMLDGLGLTALKGALMARAPREIARLIIALGGEDVTAYGLAHLGDYEATLFSEHSHNRRYGELFVQGLPFDKLAEGVATLEGLHYLSKQTGVELPICDCVRSVIFDKHEPRTALDQLFKRPLKREFI